jgi:hypothetical protein
MVTNSIRKNDFILNVRLDEATLYVGQYPLRKGPAVKRVLNLPHLTEDEFRALATAIEDRPEMFADVKLEDVVQTFRQ